MKSFIITHPGSAHKDDFLACSMLIAEQGIPIFRRDPTENELNNPDIITVDVGLRHEPEKQNFDHHQFPREHPPTCALSLVLQHLSLYEDAISFCPWMETAEWLDVKGPRKTAEWLNVDPHVVNQLSSPIDFSMLRYFGEETELYPGHPTWEIMRRIGWDLLNYLRTMRNQLDALDGHVQTWRVGALNVCVLPRVEGMAPDTAAALDMYVRELNLEISATVYPDKRGDGYGLCRFNDDLRFDFTGVAGESDVHFVHKQGFIAKTSTTDFDRLNVLLRQSLVE